MGWIKSQTKSETNPKVIGRSVDTHSKAGKAGRCSPQDHQPPAAIPTFSLPSTHTTSHILFPAVTPAPRQCLTLSTEWIVVRIISLLWKEEPHSVIWTCLFSLWLGFFICKMRQLGQLICKTFFSWLLMTSRGLWSSQQSKLSHLSSKSSSQAALHSDYVTGMT